MSEAAAEGLETEINKDHDPRRVRVALRDPVMWVLTGVACVLAIWGTHLAVGDPRGEHPWSLFLPLGAAVIPTAWSVASLIWKNYPAQFAIGDATVRMLVVPLVVTIPLTIAAAITVSTPYAVRAIEQGRLLMDGEHYSFSVRDGSPLGLMSAGVGLVGFGVAGIAGLVVWVFAVLPALVFGNPKKFIEVNQLDTSEEHVESNSVASKALSVFLMLAFAVPTFIIVGKENASTSEVGKAFKRCLLVFSEPGYYWGDMMWVLGILLVPGVLALVMIIKLFQKDTSGNR